MKQRLAATLTADAAGFSRLMTIDHKATEAALDIARVMFRLQVVTRRGRVIDMAGDVAGMSRSAGRAKPLAE